MLERQAQPAVATGRAARVLLVEDDARLRRIVARHLTIHGYVVHEVAGVAAAIVALAHQTPDLLLLDIDLPDGTGWDLLRRAALSVDVAVFLVTGAPVSAAQLAEFRPAGYLPKPFALDALVHLLEERSRATAQWGE
jgi:DNA-binding response OmpR family regulator